MLRRAVVMVVGLCAACGSSAEPPGGDPGATGAPDGSAGGGGRGGAGAGGNAGGGAAGAFSDGAANDGIAGGGGDAGSGGVAGNGGAGGAAAGGTSGSAGAGAGGAGSEGGVGKADGAADARDTGPGDTSRDRGPIERGRFTAMTYNVAGLPGPISSSDPANNTPRIGELVNGYDIVAVQEDFNYHAALYAADRHVYRTPTSGGVPFGSGLNLMSNWPFDDAVRVKWNDCTDADCLTPKGFFLVRLHLGSSTLLDVYDLHANAGATDANKAARRANVAQLADYIERVSAGNAVLVLGDTNTRYTRGADDQIADFVDRLALRDVWVDLARGGVRPTPPDPLMDCTGHWAGPSCEVVDKIFYRSSPRLQLVATAIDSPDALFSTDAGLPLSDHHPLFATFEWEASSSATVHR